MTAKKRIPIGIDFGTTNTTLVYYPDGPEGNAKLYKLDGNGGGEYFPSVVAYPKEPNLRKNSSAPRTIGANAIDEFLDGGTYLCRHFKLLLGADDAGALDAEYAKPQFIEYAGQYRGAERTPSEVAFDFFNSLFKKFLYDNRKLAVAPLTIDQLSVVITVPVDWIEHELREDRTRRGNPLAVLREVLTKVGFSDANDALFAEPNLTFEKEPVAATAFFAADYFLAHQKTSPNGFVGKVLVFDWGGGTLDVTLCEIEKGTNERGGYMPKIKRIASGAGGGDGSHFGVGGVAFDRDLMRVALLATLSAADAKNAAAQPRKFDEATKLLLALEKHKLRRPLETARALHTYLVTPDEQSSEGNAQLFCVPNTEYYIKPSMMLEAFRAANLPALKRAFKQIFDYAPELETANDTTLRVVMAGGFSQCVLAVHAVMTTLKVKDAILQCDPEFDGTRDPRFHDLTTESVTLAIAKGAAHIAAKQATIEHRFSWDLGLVYTERDGTVRQQPREKFDSVVIQEGEAMSDLVGKWRYAPDPRELTSERGTFNVEGDAEVKIFYRRKRWAAPQTLFLAQTDRAEKNPISGLGISWINESTDSVKIWIAFKVDRAGQLHVRIEDATNPNKNAPHERAFSSLGQFHAPGITLADSPARK